MFDRQRKLGINNNKKNNDETEKHLAIIKEPSETENYVDFIPKTNKSYGIIDLEKLIDVPDIQETNIEKEDVRQKNDQTNNVGLDFSISISINQQGEQTVLLNPNNKKQKINNKENKHNEIRKIFNKEVEIPFTDPPKHSSKIEIETINLNGEIIQQYKNLEFLESPKPNVEFLQQEKTKQWDVGAFGEPRIIARNPQTNEIMARYALDGTCVVGEGYPPLKLNHKSNNQTPIIITPGPKEWFLMQEMYNKKNNPEENPHLICFMKDMEWKYIISGMRNKNVIITRSKTEDSQIEWAVELQKTLRNKFGVVAEIRPKVDPLPILNKNKKSSNKM